MKEFNLTEAASKAHGVLTKWHKRAPDTSTDFEMFEVLGDMMDVFDLKICVVDKKHER